MATTTKHYLLSSFKWLATGLLLVGGVMLVRHFCMESYRVSTNSMEAALHKGDYILVNKIPQVGNPGRNRVVLFTSPLLKDTMLTPLFLSRCIGMPGDTIFVGNDGYKVNGKLLPHSPRSLNTYSITAEIKTPFMAALKKQQIPVRDLREDTTGLFLNLTSFEEYELREELAEADPIHFRKEQTEEYSLIIPQKGRAYRLDRVTLTACREAIRTEAGEQAVFKDGKLYLDGRETSFFFFSQDYYWMLSDNANEAIDSRHLGLVPRSHVIGNAWFCWYSPYWQRIFKFVN